MLPFSLRQLTYFVAVAEGGSVRAAAEALRVSATAITEALNELERDLGTTLLHRQRAVGAKLTTAGATLIGQARVVLDAAGSLRARAEHWQNEPAGSLLLGCYATLSPFIAARLLHAFQHAFPAIDVDLRDGSQEMLLSALDEGRIEAALLYEYGLTDRLAWETLYRVRPYAILPTDHALAAQPSVRLAELAGDPLILYDAAPAGANTLSMFAHASVQPRISRRTANYELVRSMVGAGLGYSVLLQRPASDLTHDGGRVACRAIGDRLRDFSIVLAWPSGNQLSRRAECFRELCRARARDGTAGSPIDDHDPTRLGGPRAAQDDRVLPLRP